MASYNRVILVGNLTRDVELRYIPSGTAVADIGLAVNDRVKRNNEWVEETTFVEVTLWARTAEVASEYLSKGSPILIEGRLKFDSWEDRDTGQKRSKLKVIADRMQMLGTRGGGGGGGGGGGRSASSQQDSDYSEPADPEQDYGSSSGQPADDIPF